MADGKKEKDLTKRADLLLQALDCINRDDYDDFQKYLIFGGSLEELLEDADHPGQETGHESNKKAREILEGLRDFNADRLTKYGRHKAMVRTSLDKSANPNPVAGLDRLGRVHPPLADTLKRSLDAPHEDEAASDWPESGLEELDAYYAKEVLGKLSKIVRRVSTLESLDIQGIPDERVRKYFGEAHRCYLYGFPVACAVLCRAILESALVEVIDPDERIDRLLVEEAKKSGKQKQSYIGRLLEEAKKKHILTDDRPECAIDVIKAGNHAIHKYAKFKSRLQDPHGIANLVDFTRKILIDLYTHRS